ncbi:hypothetical protein FIBSPDRAFT_895304 [Athelia psychrophila]|uniref:Uncharacterized protein n=1 Tax=Athelia psychrophila TaxID=1759441 RepID=A0A166EU17_9AGAM|nr:hypothetical protein FIBSPDRAFT_895304 [Fibularhizoctonia sp. CBS 109695]
MSRLSERTQLMKASVVEQHGKSGNDLYEILVVEMGKLAHEIREAKSVDGEDIIEAVGIPEDEARCHFEAMEPHIRNILVIAGDLIEQHPALAGILLPSVVGMVARGPWLLRPIFGLLGFEPSSTLKGKAAAWAQSRFFGAHIPTREYNSENIGRHKSQGGGESISGVGMLLAKIRMHTHVLPVWDEWEGKSALELGQYRPWHRVVERAMLVWWSINRHTNFASNDDSMEWRSIILVCGRLGKPLALARDAGRNFQAIKDSQDSLASEKNGHPVRFQIGSQGKLATNGAGV